jgi:hypothetical protein
MYAKRITFKLGPMRKPVAWLTLPLSEGAPENMRELVCDKRSVKVNLDTGKAVMAGVEYDLPAEVVSELKSQDIPRGAFAITGGGRHALI